MGDGVLVGAVVIHLPDFLVAALRVVHVVDFGFGDTGDAAAEAQDDLVGEAMGDLAGGVFGGVFAVLLGEHLRVLGFLASKRIAVDREAVAGDAERAEGNHGGVDRSGGPLRQADLGGGAGCGSAGPWISRRGRRCRRWRGRCRGRCRRLLERGVLGTPAVPGLKSATAMRVRLAALPDSSSLISSCARVAGTASGTSRREGAG